MNKRVNEFISHSIKPTTVRSNLLGVAEKKRKNNEIGLTV